MISVFIALFIVVISFNFFMLSYQINGVNRLVISTPIALFETAINLFDINEEEGPYFIKDILEDNLTSYFNYSIRKYTEEFIIDFYYYDPTTGAMNLNEEIKAVELIVKANLTLNYRYQKTMFYEIRSFLNGN